MPDDFALVMGVFSQRWSISWSISL